MSSAEKDMNVETKTAHGQNADDQSVAHGLVLLETLDDDAVLRANGHEAEMVRQFSWVSALGLGFSITNSWIGYAGGFGQNLIYGGPQSAIFGLVAAIAVQTIITTGLAEIASAYPSSGGQYHFCYILCDQKTKRFTAYVMGWMSVLGWWLVMCSGLALSGTTLGGLLSYSIPGYELKAWHVYFYYMATGVIAIVPVFVASKRLKYVVQTSLALTLAGSTVWLFVPVGMHNHTQPASFIVQSGLGTSGWGAGVAWVMGITNSMYAFVGTDAVIHISEEMPHPGRRMPQVMLASLALGFSTTFALFLVLIFFSSDLDAITSSNLASLEIVRQGVAGNRSVTIFLVTFLYLVCFSAIPSQFVTSGRLAWAFARDNGVPFSRYFAKVDDRLEFPVRTTVASFIFTSVYGLLYLASTNAFNSIINTAVLFLNITYAVPQGLLLFQGQRKNLPKRYLNLGWFGIFCNVFSVSWIIVHGVIVCFPATLPVSKDSMNYISAVGVGLFSIIVIFWFVSGRKNFTGPKIDWDYIKRSG